MRELSWLLYTSTGWWVPTTAQQAVPMLCVVEEKWQAAYGVVQPSGICSHDNAEEKGRVTLPDQDTIRHKCRSCFLQVQIGHVGGHI